MTFSKLCWVSALVGLAMTSIGCAEGDMEPGAEAPGEASDALTFDPAAVTLQGMEYSLNQASSAIINYSVVTSQPGQTDKLASIKTTRKGSEFRVDFLSPADKKGTKLLLLSSGDGYVYTPASGKTKKLGPGAVDGMMMGIACSLRSLADTRFSDTHNPTSASPQGSDWSLTLTKKSTSTSPFNKLQFVVQDFTYLPTEIQYIDASNALVVRETRSNYTCQGSACEASLRTCARASLGVTSKATRTAWAVNPTVADSVFLPGQLAD